MTKLTLRRAIVLAAALFPAAASAQLAELTQQLKPSGDIRFRAEDDWDSHTGAGVERPVRDRLRIRARFGIAPDLGDGFRLTVHARTATSGSQQNANVTFKDFDGNATDKLRIIADRYSLAWRNKAKTVSVEGGRMGFPFFTTNEYLLDADLTPLGVGGSAQVFASSKAKLRFVGGAWRLPVGLAEYSGALYAGQAVLDAGPITVATGLFRFDADRNDPDRLILLDGNGSRNYSVLAINTQYRLKAGGRPLAFTADFYRNLQGYANSDALSASLNNQRTGYVLGVAWGDTAAHHLQLGYRWSHIEKLSVDASYSHDDVARLGTASQAALSDLKGHDMYLNYGVTRHLQVGIRAMIMERITTVEDDKRARFDITYSL